MPLIVCQNCGKTFDTDREPATSGASTTRCPSCGTDHADALADVDDDSEDDDGQETTPAPGDGAASVTVAPGDGLRIRLDVHLHVHMTEGNG